MMRLYDSSLLHPSLSTSKLPFLLAACLGLLGLEQAPGQALFGHYRFDEPSNLKLDSSGAGHHASYTFCSGANCTQFPRAIGGVSGGAIGFDGTNGLSWDSDTALPAALTGSYSVSLWLKTTQVQGSDSWPGFLGAAIFGDAFGNDHTLLALTGSKVDFSTENSSYDLHSSSSINSGQFVHVVVTRDAVSGEKRLFINGDLENEETGSTGAFALAPNSEVRLGIRYGAGFRGVVDELQIYEGVLSPAQTAYLFDNPAGTVTGAPTLGDSVDAPELSWSTGGSSPWFAQTMESFDGADAAQSGPLDFFQSNYLETTVQGPGTLSFRWKSASPDDEGYLQFLVNGVDMDELSGDSGWVENTFELGPGANTLRWTYFNFTGPAEDAGFVDTVSFAQPIDVNLQFEIARGNNNNAFYGGADTYSLFPFFNFISPLPLTTGHVHQAVSPNERFIAQQGGGFSSSSRLLGSLDDVLNEATNGFWRLYLNKGSAAEKLYTFAVTINGLDTNTLGRTVLLSPTNGSVNVSTNPVFHWSGPDWNSTVFVSVQNPPTFTRSTNATLALGTTNWTALARPYGTNRFRARYSANNGSYVQTTTPTGAGLPPLNSWVTSTRLVSEASIDFVVGAAVPVPVPDASLAVSNETACLTFSTQPGRIHTLQVKTNLTTAPWISLTNFVGNGDQQKIPLPFSSAHPEGYYRIVTQ